MSRILYDAARKSDPGMNETWEQCSGDSTFVVMVEMESQQKGIRVSHEKSTEERNIQIHSIQWKE